MSKALSEFDLWGAPDFNRPSRYDETAEGRLNNAKIILKEFLDADLPLGIALAAVVNAKHESDLSNKAAGDGGNSIGLFQINSRWHPLTPEERKDPIINTRYIIKMVKRYGGALTKEYNNGASVAELSVIFGRDIERPKNKGVGRDKTARELFPAFADLDSTTLSLGDTDLVAVDGDMSENRLLVLSGVAFIFASGALMYTLYKA